MKKNLTIVFLSILFSMHFSMHCMDVELKKESLEAGQDVFSHLKQTMELYNQGLAAWEEALKLQNEIKKLSLEMTKTKKINEVEVGEYKTKIYEKYSKCVEWYCGAQQHLLDAYYGGYKQGYDTAYDRKTDMNEFENTYIPPYMKKDPPHSQDRQKQLVRLIAVIQSTESTATRTTLSTALEHCFKIYELNEQFKKFREEILPIFLNEVEEGCKEFWLANVLNHPKAGPNLSSILALLNPSFWTLSERSRQLLEQVQTTIERTYTIENNPTSTSSTSQLSLLQARKEDSKCTYDSSRTESSLNPITQAVLTYDQANQTLKEIEERKSKKRHDEALCLYGIAIEGFLNAHEQGYSPGLEAALKTYEDLESYEKLCKHKSQKKDALKSALQSHRTKRQELYKFVKTANEKRGNNNFPSAHYDQLFSVMEDHYNRACKQLFLCEALLGRLKLKMAEDINKVKNSATLVAEASAKTFMRGNVADGSIAHKDNFSCRSFINAVRQLVEPSKWSLSKEEKDCIELKNQEIQRKIAMESYTSLLVLTFKEKESKKEPVTAMQFLQQTRRAESTSLSATAAALLPALVVADSTSLSEAATAALVPASVEPDSSAITPRSSSEQTGKRTSGPSLKRLSMRIKGLLRDSTNTDG